MFRWIKRKAIYMRMADTLIEELDRSRTPVQENDLRRSLHDVQRLIINRFQNIEGFMNAARASQLEFQIELEHKIYQDYEAGISADNHLGLLVMHHFIAGIREHHSTAANKLGGAIGRVGMVPGFVTLSERRASVR